MVAVCKQGSTAADMTSSIGSRLIFSEHRGSVDDKSQYAPTRRSITATVAAVIRASARRDTAST